MRSTHSVIMVKYPWQSRYRSSALHVQWQLLIHSVSTRNMEEAAPGSCRKRSIAGVQSTYTYVCTRLKSAACSGCCALVADLRGVLAGGLEGGKNDGERRNRGQQSAYYQLARAQCRKNAYIDSNLLFSNYLETCLQAAGKLCFSHSSSS